MTYKHTILGLALAFGALSFGGGVGAQQLSSGDLEQCSVYDKDGDFAGYDSVCMSEKQAALRDLQPQNDYDRRHWLGPRGGHRDHYYDPNYVSTNPYPCPAWANNGTGYPTTLYTDGGPYEYVGIFDAPVNRVACHPNPVIFVKGF